IAQDGELISATNAITLQDLDVSEVGDGGFKDQFGMSLPMALALLRDHERKISLDVPIERKGDETDLGLGRLTVDALRTALVGALTSPLKLVFAAVPGGDDDAAQPLIACEPTRDSFPEASHTQIEQLAALLRARPSLAVSMRGQVGPEDGKAKRADSSHLDALAQSRTTKLGELLTQQYGVAPDQVRVDPRVPVGAPGVSIELIAR
ncbi:MAG: hypothetical protein GY944_27395, partial [bacterium]|nr:hypothetical protein [bacterium]